MERDALQAAHARLGAAAAAGPILPVPVLLLKDVRAPLSTANAQHTVLSPTPPR
ncbi:hypothetical protein ACH4SP_11370 [Streptomyces sp. NPDC021093]|uniref:hypothetical protein n=1 Tax=Streptomyces sp. NPDC021093 TaxID=3365112 RepID=UPI0037B8BB89